MHSAHRRRFELMSSSPPPSSSPPRTPRHAHTRAEVYSSPDTAYRGIGQRSWGRYPAAPAKEQQPKHSHPRVHHYTSSYAPDHFYGSNSYGYGYPHPPQSDYDVSEYAYTDDVAHYHDVPDLDSEPASASDSVPAHSQSSGVFSDFSEEEEKDDADRAKDDDDDDIDAHADGLLSFGYGGSRATFFRTSAERGQWKTNPMPYKAKPSIPTSILAPAPTSKPITLITRKSEPTASRAATPAQSHPLPTPTVFNRPISEPVFSAPRLPENEVKRQDHSDSERATAQNIRTSAEPPAFVPGSADPSRIQTPVAPPTAELEDEEHATPAVPALSEDRGSSVDMDVDANDSDEQALYTPSSPLPPSSLPSSPLPPSSPLLPASSVPPMSRSVSPIPITLDHDDESTSFRGSSPLSELPDDEEEEDFPEVETECRAVEADADVEMHTLSQNQEQEVKPSPTKVSPLAISALLCAPVDPVSPSTSSAVPSSFTAPGAPAAPAVSESSASLDVSPEVAAPAPPQEAVEAVMRENDDVVLPAPAPAVVATPAKPEAEAEPKSETEPKVVREATPEAAPTPAAAAAVSELAEAETVSRASSVNLDVDVREKKEEAPPVPVVVEAKHQKVEEALRDKKNVKTAEKRKSEQQEGRDDGVKKKKQKVVAAGNENQDTAEASSSSSKSASKPIVVSSAATAGADLLKAKTKPKAKKRTVEDVEGGGVTTDGDDAQVPLRPQQQSAPRPKKRKRSETPGGVAPADGDSSSTSVVMSTSAPLPTAASTSALASTSKSSGGTAKRAAGPRRKARVAASFSDSEDEEAGDSTNTTTTTAAAATPDDTEALHVQITGLLIETMATSRASSLAVSTLYKMLMKAQPSLRAERTQKEWCRLFDRVLRAGEAGGPSAKGSGGGGGSGVFGKVESSGKDDADRPLEAQWFYVPEMDEDQERAAVIRAMMPRPAKRSETKKYKQYYWRPLDKISRWDPEDEL